MKVKYCKNRRGNFGDDLNDWLWPKLIPELLEKEDDNYLIGIGSIFNANYNTLSGKKIVFSPGTGYKFGAVIDESWDIIGVRGSKTAETYRLAKDKVLCDGAYLLRRVLDVSEFSDGYKTGFMPHHSSIDLFDWPLECEKLGLYYISPEESVDNILEKMKECNKIITEAMHGAIVADALRIPWCAVSYSPTFLKFKWDDWTSVLDIDAVIHQLPFVVKSEVSRKLIRSWKIKQFFGYFGLGSKKWINFSKIYDNNKNKELLINKLDELKQSTHFQLSDDESMLRLDNKLDIALNYLKNTY